MTQQLVWMGFILILVLIGAATVLVVKGHQDAVKGAVQALVTAGFVFFLTAACAGWIH